MRQPPGSYDAITRTIRWPGRMPAPGVARRAELDEYSTRIPGPDTWVSHSPQCRGRRRDAGDQGPDRQDRQRRASNSVRQIGRAQPGKTLPPSKGSAGYRDRDACHSVSKVTHRRAEKEGNSWLAGSGRSRSDRCSPLRLLPGR